VYLIGEDAPRIAEALPGIPHSMLESLDQAFELASRLAKPGQVVLLSPACASFDQFDSFEARGDAFRKLIHEQA